MNVRVFWIGVFFLGALHCSDGAEEKALPRVLILGDSVYQQVAMEVGKALKGKVEVVYVRMEAGEVRNSSTVLADLDRFIGGEPWDMIHFNVGLGDLIYRVPGMKSFRVCPRSAGGVRATSPELYEKNLRELAKRLKATGAQVVWASTTPIRASSSDVFELKSEIAYNAIAARVMKEQGVPVNDMYRFVYDLIDMNKPASHGADPFSFERKPIHGPVLELIRKGLGVP